MLRRFCLYGFVKNQKYFEPFLYLAFRDKGLSFTAIGALIGFREICINLMEIPTGAAADVLGRRRAMILSHAAYIGAFVVFGLLDPLWALFGAMFLFSIGEAFRTGTHKAIIFDWLARQGRGDEKTRVYGFTRSWSKLGSALGVVIAAVLVFVTGDYRAVFLFCILPYALNIVNFLTYPKYLDGEHGRHRSAAEVARTLFGALGAGLRKRPLRRLLGESMAFEGMFKASRDYLQPVLRVAALSAPVFLYWTDRQRTAVLVGAVYVVLHLLGSYASRHADALARRAGSEARGARWLWAIDLAVFAVLGAGILAGAAWIAIAAFAALAVAQNFWRPMLISRVAHHAESSQMATVLSIESQAKTLFTAVAAPLLGLAIDAMPAELMFLPIAVLGVVVAAGMLATGGGEKS